jgi:molybdopterin converting factor small subunit
MTIEVRYWSWFRDITRTEGEGIDVPDAATVGDVLDAVHRRHPRLAEARRSTLVAVGLDYQPLTHPLHPGDQVSLFPPVQGG